MLFNSFQFIFIFLPITFTIFYVLDRFEKHNAVLVWLTSASLFFYGYWHPIYLLLIGGSILYNFTLGNIISLQGEKHKKLILTIGIAGNLLLLGYFKYTNFLIEFINDSLALTLSPKNIVLPLAISFFTFQQIAYLVDVYKEKVQEHNFIHYCLFVTFSPQLLAGPIVHHSEMMPQFTGNRRLANFDLIGPGIYIFCIGLLKKIIIADFFGAFANIGYGNVYSLSSIQAWITNLSYTFQLYFDFSGYTDMAIGTAMIFGIRLPINFNSPYKAKNIIEFWRCWHMTLSRFLRDYLYIPLGGNRKGTYKRYRNLIITMVLGGLWHGANYTFIIWGFLHGVYLMINHAWHFARTNILGHNFSKESIIGIYLSKLVTFGAVSFAWIFFRAASTDEALSLINKMLCSDVMSDINFSFPNLNSYFLNDEITFARFLFDSSSANAYCLCLLVITYVILQITDNSNKLKDRFRPTFFRSLYIVFALSAFIVINIYVDTTDEFLYYRF